MKKSMNYLFVVIIMVLSNCEIDRNVQSLSGKWQFKYDRESVGDVQGYYLTNYNRQDWTGLNVPAFWDDPQYDGIGWYAVNFKVRKSLTHGRIAIIFEAVDDDAIVYLNGEKVGEHSGHGVQFYVEITGKFNLTGSNILVVRINDTGGAGGITGDVRLQGFEFESDLLKSEYFQTEAIPIPEWLKTACIYEVFVRAYSPEGNFQALTADLPRIKAMGYDCIWLMPIFPIGEKNRKGTLGSPYSIRDFRGINPDFGTGQDLKNLVNNAHQSGIKVILDIACNHSSWDNLLIEQHPDWYTHDSLGQIIPPNTDWSDVADFNYNQAGLRNYMWGSLEYWVKEFDVDGFRLDVAELVPDDFWVKALKRLQKIKPGVLMLAEGDHPRLYRNGFHLTYGWNTRRAFYQIMKNDYPASFLGETLTREYYRYPRQALKMRFTENHDEERTVALYSTGQARLLTFLTFTLPGVPMVYAGQEVAAITKPSLFEKSQINWRQFDDGMNYLIGRMNVLRRENSALTKGAYQLLESPEPASIFMFARNDNRETALVVVNMKSVSETITIDLETLIP
ncbi:MAG: alpha-amylase family glycosyl hydrolase, partial [Candidatus Neomarinimicrobiota bacterium]